MSRVLAVSGGGVQLLDYASLADFFSDEGITYPFSWDNLPDGMPVRAHAIRITGGLGLTVEQAFDRITFMVLTRGPEGRSAYEMSMAVDDAWLDADSGFDLGGYYVVDKGRFGGPPAFVGFEDNNKPVRSAVYWGEIAR